MVYQWVQKWLNQQIRILLSAAIGDIKDYGVSQKWVGKYSILYTASKLCVAMSFTVWIFIVHEIIKAYIQNQDLQEKSNSDNFEIGWM